MSFIRGFVDRLLLICAIVAGGLVPGFVSQYRQRLGGMLDQARIDLTPWQRIADQYFHGDLSRLVQYHLASKDPTFHAEGAAISSLVASVQNLQSEVAALHGNIFQQAVYLSLHVDPAIAHATLGDWVPTFGLSTDGISFALVFALCLWLLFQILWSAGAMGGRGLARRRARRYAASTASGTTPVTRGTGKM
ncbi:MAG TPA: DUF2937 family protein [Steroidobacteraceae bacterium]|jgi:hypothetical protein|nr:DUF2937 family protein [Steroidobacteraceae bacterium]